MADGNIGEYAVLKTILPSEDISVLNVVKILFAIARIIFVPTAEQRWMEVMSMAEYIDRQAAIDTFNRAVQDVGILDADDIETVFEMLSSANVVQVVRCKDCKYNATTHKCLNPDSFFLIPKDDDFCSYGERKE